MINYCQLYDIISILFVESMLIKLNKISFYKEEFVVIHDADLHSASCFSLVRQATPKNRKAQKIQKSLLSATSRGAKIVRQFEKTEKGFKAPNKGIRTSVLTSINKVSAY